MQKFAKVRRFFRKNSDKQFTSALEEIEHKSYPSVKAKSHANKRITSTLLKQIFKKS